MVRFVASNTVASTSKGPPSGTVHKVQAKVAPAQSARVTAPAQSARVSTPKTQSLVPFKIEPLRSLPQDRVCSSDGKNALWIVFFNIRFRPICVSCSYLWRQYKERVLGRPSEEYFERFWCNVKPVRAKFSWFSPYLGHKLFLRALQKQRSPTNKVVVLDRGRVRGDVRWLMRSLTFGQWDQVARVVCLFHNTARYQDRGPVCQDVQNDRTVQRDRCHTALRVRQATLE